MLSARNARVRIFARRRRPEIESGTVETVIGDVRDPQAVDRACRGADTVFHTAGLPGIWGAWAEYYDVNVVGTTNVIQACRRNGVRRLIFTSSPSVVHEGRDIEAGSETLPYARHFKAPYPATKAEAERRVLAANGSDTPNGPLFTCAIRPHLLWGPGDPHLVPRILHLARTGRLRQIGDGRNRVDLTHVDNAAHAHLLAAEQLTEGGKAPGQTYFITDGRPVRLWEWISNLLKAAGLPPVSGKLPLPLARILAAACEALYRIARVPGEPPLTRFLVDHLGTSHWFDISKARADLEYDPIVEPEEGFTRLIEWVNGMPEGAST